LSGLGEGDVMMGLSFVGQFRFFSVCAGEEGVVYLFLPVGSAFALSLCSLSFLPLHPSPVPTPQPATTPGAKRSVHMVLSGARLN
jgi:hypothetical protein